MDNVIVWADIPVKDLKRASEFYRRLTGQAVEVMPGSGDTVAVIGSPVDTDSDQMVVSADLYVGGTPRHDGVTIYLNSYGDIDGMLARAAEAGGTILEAKQDMGPMIGWLAYIEDTEGNRIGIQQPS